MRSDSRPPEAPRPLKMTRHFTSHPAGSVLVEGGLTRLLVTASVVEQVPAWLRGGDRGWVTAEYSMLPGSTPDRKTRDGRGGKVDGRSTEIQRLIGRSLRAVVDLEALPERAVYLDCDVLQADGGTRTLAITGAWVALHDACKVMEARGDLRRWPLKDQVAAVSVGIVDGAPLVDLCYAEDSRAEVDMNVVMTAGGDFVEVQGSAEKGTFSPAQLTTLLELAQGGIERFLAVQREVLAS